MSRSPSATTYDIKIDDFTSTVTKSSKSFQCSFKRKQDVVIPSLFEQEKIASILSKVDELIQKTDQVIEQTQKLKKGLMQKLLIYILLLIYICSTPCPAVKHTKQQVKDKGLLPVEYLKTSR